jgi:mannose-1-phosphate guanylyltransferase/mannose-6-phosphate isomerase
LTLEVRAPGALMLVASTDHMIPDVARFHDVVQAAATAASAGQLFTFGILPDRPEMGYGWLELSTPTPDFAPLPQPLRSFVEKPDFATAETLLAGGMHLWIAGIFLFSTNTILDAFAAHAPEVLASTRAAFEAAEKDLSSTRLAPHLGSICLIFQSTTL